MGTKTERGITTGNLIETETETLIGTGSKKEA